MVDSPTSRNRFRLQETGTNNNIWGVYLNEVISCVDQVVDGVESINLGAVATYTLTTTNYSAADEAKNRILQFTNAHASGTDVVIPSVEHEYGVYNNGGADIEVRTAAGSGVTIPTGYYCQLYCDGSDVYARAWYFNGRVRGSAAVANSEFTTLQQVSALIAAASITGTGNTFKISADDTTSKYAEDAIVGASGGGIIFETANGGANEQLRGRLNVNGMTAGTTVDPTADYVPLYDASAGTHIKVLPQYIADEGNLCLAAGVFAL